MIPGADSASSGCFLGYDVQHRCKNAPYAPKRHQDGTAVQVLTEGPAFLTSGFLAYWLAGTNDVEIRNGIVAVISPTHDIRVCCESSWEASPPA